MSLSLSLPIYERKALDNSVAGTHDRCERLALYNYILNRASRSENYPINFGVAYHKFRENLEKLYTQWVTHDGADIEVVEKALFEAAWAVSTLKWFDPPIEHKKSYLDLTRLEETCREAFAMFLNEKQRGYYKVIGTETGFHLPLPSGRFWTGRLDQIIEWNGRLWVRDFKTLGRKEDWKLKYLVDHQFTGYVWAAQELSGRRVDGVIVDIVYNVKTKGPEFHPTLASRNKEDIETWLEWAENRWDRWEDSFDRKNWFLSTVGCNDFGGCFFREACAKGSDWHAIEEWLEENTIYSEWDPLNPEGEEGLPE